MVLQTGKLIDRFLFELYGSFLNLEGQKFYANYRSIRVVMKLYEILFSRLQYVFWS